MPTTALPEWIKPVEGFKSRYVLDPDKFYPAILAELSKHYKDLDPSKPDQYWLEVSHQVAKLDAQVAIRAAGLHRTDVSTVFIIRGGDGYKKRWALSEHPPGERLEAMLKSNNGDRKKTDKQIAKEARGIYKTLRGFLPA